MHIRTPLLWSAPLSTSLRDVWLKLEVVQPTGSFKDRGVGTASRRAVERGATALVSSSGGNAGMAVAWAGRQLGVPVTVAVPESTATLVRERLGALGATVVVRGAAWDEAHAWASAYATEIGAAYVSPFDHPDIWDGHSTLIDELVAQRDGRPPGAVVVSVGGGGLMCGVLQGMHAHGWSQVPMIAVETVGADSLACSIDAGKRVALDGITSIAKTLGARQVAAEAWAWTERHEVRSVRVTDAEALSACRRFLDDHRYMVEPSCGAALAAVYGRAAALDALDDIVVVVCGGSGVTVKLLERWAQE